VNDNIEKHESNNTEDDLFEALFAQAVIKSFEDELAAIPPREELEKMYTFSDRHKARMEKLFKLDRRRDRRKRIVFWGRRVAVALTVSITVFSAALMFVPSVRAAVADVVIQWFDQFTKFSSNPDIENVTSVGAWEPHYLPDGFEIADTLIQDDINQFIYSDADGKEIVFTYVTGIGSISVNNEKVTYRTETHEGIVYQIFESQETGIDSSIVWDMNGYSFLVSGECPIAELVNIAISVK
jgi:hypothetical protein